MCMAGSGTAVQYACSPLAAQNGIIKLLGCLSSVPIVTARYGCAVRFLGVPDGKTVAHNVSLSHDGSSYFCWAKNAFGNEFDSTRIMSLRTAPPGIGATGVSANVSAKVRRYRIVALCEAICSCTR